jgi:hypothetical protein
MNAALFADCARAKSATIGLNSSLIEHKPTCHRAGARAEITR